VGTGEESEDEDASKEVVLVSELYAFRGAAWFDERSLQLVRLPGRDTEAE